MSRYDLVSPRRAKNSDKTYFTKVGVAFTNNSGDGFTLSFEALPLPDAEGQTRVLMMPAKPKEDREHPRQGNRPAARDEDSIPFAPETR